MKPRFVSTLLSKLLLGTFCLLTAMPLVAQETELFQCQVDLLSMQEIIPCDQPAAKSSSEIWSNLQPQPTIVNQYGTTCSFQFWSFDGQYIPGDETEEITVPEGDSKKAVAWYVCSGQCEGEFCPTSTHVIGLDLTRNARTVDSVVQSVNPTSVAGSCLGSSATNPCSTTAGAQVTSIRAKSSVDGLRFVSWAHQNSGDRDLANPSGLAVALYTDEENPRHCERVKAHLGLERICVPPFEPTFPNYSAEIPMWWREHGFVIPDICPIDGCPECAGTCPGGEYVFTNAQGFDITLYDLRSREPIAWAERFEDDLKRLAFQPHLRKGERFQDAYAFVFTAIGDYDQAQRFNIGVDFKTGCDL